MADKVLFDPYIDLDGNDLSAQCKQVTLPQEVEQLDGTRGGDTTRRNVPGLKNWSMTATFVQDFSPGGLDSIISGLLGSAITVEVRSDTDAVGGSNPKFTADGMIASYNPLGQQVGELVEVEVEIVPAYKAAGPTLVRATS